MWRALLHTGKLWRVDMPDATTLVQGAVGEDNSEALFLVCQLAMPDYTLGGNLRVPGLDPAGRYRITLLDHPDINIVGDGGHTMRKLPGWMEAPQIVSGEWLAQAGLALPILDPESAILIGFERV